MQHLTLTEYGQFIGIRSECLTVKEDGHHERISA